jgi:hypothetical protein
MVSLILLPVYPVSIFTAVILCALHALYLPEGKAGKAINQIIVITAIS